MANSNSTGEEKVFEYNWVIKNWKEVVQTEALTENTTIEINLKSGNQSYGKVLQGTSLDNNDYVGFYCKFLCGHQCLRDVKCNLLAVIFKRDGAVGRTYSITLDALSGSIKQIVSRFWGCSNTDSTYASWTTTEGSLDIKMKFTLTNLPTSSCFSKVDKSMGTFRTEIIRNFSALLDEKSSSDIKIITKDEKELFSHTTILRAQCPVFASMFASEYQERSTGLIKIDDISSKAMKILLNYWYTGDLLPSWSDDDIIVEFTYAAGKYQMTHVLNMLYDVLGCDFGTSDGDIELLKMTQKLCLEKAEGRILKRVIHKIYQCTKGSELLQMFYINPDAFGEESFTVAQIAEAWNDALNQSDDKEANCADVKFMVLACKLGLKNVESNLLKRIIGTVSKVESTEELFAIFERCQDQQVDTSVVKSSMSLELLERVNPK